MADNRIINTVLVDVVKDNGGFYSTPISKRVSCTLTKNEEQTLSLIVQAAQRTPTCTGGTFKVGDRVPAVYPNSVQTVMLDSPEGYVWITKATYNSAFLTGCNSCCVS